MQSELNTPLRPLPYHVVLLLGLIFGQLLVISLGFDALTLVDAQAGNVVSLLGYSGYFAKAMAALVIALFLGVWPRRHEWMQKLNSDLIDHKLAIPLLFQLSCFAIFYVLTSKIFGNVEQEIHPLLSLSWLAFALGTALFWIFAFAPLRFWLSFVSSERLVLVAALAVGALALVLSLYAQALWGPLSGYTFTVSASLLELIYPDVYVDFSEKTLGTQQFVVNIAPACSGYEGIGLVTLFTAFYLSIYRQDFRFPQVLVLFPIGITAIWLLNSVRIVVLIAIGHWVSPAVAVGGFHSQAGWITFILAAIGILALAHRVPFFRAQKSRLPERRSGTLSLPLATLIPAVVLLATTLLTSALAADIDWLYPFRVLLTGGAILYCWKVLSLQDYRPTLEPVLIGVVVFAFWIVMIDIDPERDQVIGAALSDAGLAMSVFWLVFRSIGAVITVPIAEELLFRGYLLSRLSSQDISLKKAPAFSWMAFVVSSLAFGALHGAWLAGTLAGLAYGIARYRGGHVGAAILAHLTTNLILTGYVFLTGHWSAW